MRIGLISDVHSNATGLDACIAFMQNKDIDMWVFLGDLVGYMTEVEYCYERLNELCDISLLGNHDAMMLGKLKPKVEREQVYLHEYAKSKLTDSALSNISKRQPMMTKIIERKKIIFVHGSPWNPYEEYIYPDTSLERFKNVDADIIFMGHTHWPCVHYLDEKLIVNVGSCGLPRDIGNLASCSIYDSQTNLCDIYRIPFNVEKVLFKQGHLLHDTVRKCLNRSAQRPPVIGQLIEVESDK